jgi:hypothetical protein
MNINKCKQCGNITKSIRHSFCNKNCRHLFYYINIKCPTCQKEFETKKNKMNMFCSQLCRVSNIDIKNKMKISRRKHFLEKYGVESFTQTDIFKEKTRITNLKRYGVEFPQQSSEIRKKSILTSLKKYGVDNPSKNEYVKDKMKKTNLKRYGKEFIQQTEKFKEYSKKIKLKRYGNENYVNSEKIRQTCLIKYGVDNPSKDKFIKEKCINNAFDVHFFNLLSNKKITNIVDILFNRKDYIGTKKINIYPFKCKECNNNFKDHLSSGHIPRCPVCYPLDISKPQMEVYEYIKSLLPPNVDIKQNERDPIHPLEIDIYIPHLKLAFEYNGLYWHGELNGEKNKIYHLNKTEECEDKGIHLIQIIEDEWFDKKDIIKSKIKHILGCNNTERIYARNCNIKIIDNDTKNDFLEKYHIQGKDNSSIRLGAFYENNLVAVMTFGKLRKALGNKSDDINYYEMYRFCIGDKSVVGIAGKLFKFFIDNYNPNKVFSYVDRRYSNSNKCYLSNIGFKLIGKTVPGYWYFDKSSVRIHRFNFRKSELSKKLEKFDSNLTEWENMQLNGYDRIWDCGNLKYEWVK